MVHLSMPPPVSSLSSSLTITNPLVLYRSLLATKQIEPDLAQHRLALHLQKLYHRLKDYSPEIQYADRLKALTHVISKVPTEDEESAVASRRHPLRRNPLFAHLFMNKEHRQSVALTRVITSHEAAKELDSPKGLLLHGEVGRGKSMLVDLLADSLPTNKKRRWHFNTFMLETLARLEQLRVTRSNAIAEVPEYSLLWLARDMIDTSPMLFLDEFQLPDRAASKILSNLFTIFFQLGGVLIATSNRMPEELSKASGTDFTATLSSSRIGSSLGMNREKSMTHPANNEYYDFVEILKARCDIFNMDTVEPGRDWRRRELEELDFDHNEGHLLLQATGSESNQHPVEEVISRNSIQKSDSEEEHKSLQVKAPRKYIVGNDGTDEQWDRIINEAMPPNTPEQIRWQPTTLHVYGRNVSVPLQYEGIAYWTFSQLCGERFGPADYISMASTFHTCVIDRVPVLTSTLKNEARRFITLLDALYEARCKLIIRAEVGPDDLFFPETRVKPNKTNNMESKSQDVNDGADAVYPETLSEVYQDQTSPFRPNVSLYVDEDGKDYNFDKDPSSTHGLKHEVNSSVNFGLTSSFIGEDERFSYKRASSRLWEMCGIKWHSRSEPGWWRPASNDIRRWEKPSASESNSSDVIHAVESDVRMSESYEIEPEGLHGGFWDNVQNFTRRTGVEPPRFGPTHAWGVMKWGRKAGAWGQGPEGLRNRRKDGDK
ncbi:AFG1-like ATPase-domain-containing protein [Xylogone sp. PMI_703]|nr:AFG1-like ATPase-domain-containing protein [Xylogone sp. PMI_703]